uniref:Uncharacterized protein n=1 Tax=Panagrolaimus sp. PS1159 TaxID=55785 RepID=A0AC35FZ31_9BILA
MIGLEPWFFNFTHFFFGGQTKQLLADVPRPRTEYAIWWTMKCAEVSSFIGGVIVHPIYRFYRLQQLTPETTTNNSKKIIRNLCRRIQGRFLLAGIVSGPLLSLAYSHSQNWSEQDLRDKCYEIRCNTSSLQLDRYCTMFFAIGWYWKRFQGGVNGINIGIAYWAFYKTVLEKYTNPLLVDKIKPEQRYENVIAAKEDKDELTRFWRDIALKGKPENDLRKVVPSNV